MNKRYMVLLTLLCVLLFGATGWSQAPDSAVGDYGSVATGNWTNVAIWKIFSASGHAFDSTATGAPGSSSNVFIRTGTTVTYDNSSQNCKNLIVQSGATFQSNATLPTGAFVIKVNGPTIWVDGNLGSGPTDALSIETKYNGTITLGGSGTVNIGQIRPNSSQGDPMAFTFAMNANLNYAGSSAGSSGAGIQLASRGTQLTSTLTINSGVTVTLAANSDLRVNSSSTALGTANNVIININGTLDAPSSKVVLAMDATHSCTMNIGGTGVVNIGNKLTPYLAGGSIPTINVASGGQLNMLNGSTADFTNPSATVTGAGSFALQSGATINIGAGAGLDAALGPVQTTTATFDVGANYSYVGTGVQQLGALLPDSMNNLTIGSTSIDTVKSAKKVKGVLQIDGWLVNSGGLSSAGTATVNGIYQHNDTAVAGPMPIATWNTGSTCLVTALNPAASAGIPNGAQNFYNYRVDCPTLAGAGRLGMKGNTIAGNLVIHNTNDPTGAATNMAVLVPKGNPAPDTIATVTVMGDLLIDSSAASLTIGYGSTLQMAVLIVHGNIVSKGVLYGNGSGISSIFYAYGDIAIQSTGSNAFRGHSSARYPDSVVFCGTGVQRFTKPIALASMSNLRFLVKSGSSLYLDDTTAVTYGATIGTFAVDSGATLKLGHPNGLNGNLSSSVAPTLSSKANYEFNGTSAQLTGKRLPSAVNNLTINNSLGVGLDTSSAVNGTLFLTSGALSIGANTLAINGALSTTGGSLVGGPTSNIGIGGTGSGITLPAGVGSLKDLTLNNPNGAALGGSLTLGGTLTFTSGKLATSANTLTIDTSGSVSGAGPGNYVNGNLARTYLTGAQSFTYAVGDASIYAPVAMSFKNVSTGGTVAAKTTSGDHPNVIASGIDAAKSVNRYWMLTNSGLGFDTLSADFTFDPSDVDGAANTSNFLVKKYDSGVWSSPVTGTKTATSTQATGLTSMSDFAVGEAAPPTISVTGSLADFGLVGVGGSSAEQNYSVAGANLQGDILITAPADFQVSTTSGSGFGPSVTLTQSGGMVSNTTIYVRFSPGSIGAKSGNISHASLNATTVNNAVSGTGISAEPATQASAVAFTNVTPVSMTVNWTNGNGSDRIVLAKSGSAVNADPLDGTTYTADTVFGNGTQIGSGNYVVYVGSGNSVNVTGLSIGAPYYFAVYEFNGSGGTQNYLAPGAAGNQTTAHAVMLSNGSGGGVWNSGPTWQGGVVPGPFDSAVVLGTDSVSVTSNASATGLNVQPGGKVAVSAQFIPTNVILDGMIFVSADTLKPTFMAVSGTLSLTGGAVALASGAQLNILSGGTADFTNPTGTVTGAGSFALQSGATINIGASAGLDAASGPVQTTTATFDPGANYGYLGTGVQQLGALLPDSVNNLTIGSNSIDTVRAAKKVKGVLQIDGWLVNSGGLTSAGTATVNGTYQHNDTAAAVAMPIATWNDGSTCLVSRVSPTATGGIINGSQNFYLYKVDLDPITPSSCRLGLAGDTIRGNLWIHNTNTPPDTELNQIILAPKTKNATITVLGDLIIDTSAEMTISYGSGADTVALIVKGNIINRNVLYFNGSGVRNRLFVYGDFAVKSTNQSALRGHSNSNQPDSIIFCGSGVQRFTKTTTIASGSNVRFAVRSGSTLYLDDTTVVNYSGSSPGSFTLPAGATLKSGHPNGVNGNLSPGTGAAPPSLSPLASYEFNGGSAQVTGSWLPSSVSSLTVNNALGVTLSGNVQVNGTLAFTSGKLTTEANVAALGTGGTISGAGAGKYINGNLKKTMNSGADSKTFEIGDATSYAPVAVSGASYAAPFDLTAKTTVGDHPDTLHSPVNAAKSVNRYYTLTGTPTGLSDVTFNFVAGDVDEGAIPSNFIVGQNDTTAWAVAPVTGRTATSATATVTHFSDFVIGEAGAVSISGTITDGMNPMQDVTVTASGGFSGSAQTSVTGAYSLLGVPFGTKGITLTPTKTGYRFTPTTHTVDSVSDYVTGKDFTGTLNTHTLTVNIVGGGTVAKSPDQLLYDFGSTVTLTATPEDRSWKFQGWSGDATGTTDTVNVLMTGNLTVTATFVEDSVYTQTYRSFRPDSIALSIDDHGRAGKFVDRKPIATDFSFGFTTPGAGTVTFKFSMLTNGILKRGPDTIGSWSNVKTFTTATAETTGTVLQVIGRGLKGRFIKVTYVCNAVPKVLRGTILTIDQTLRLAKPNRLNALYETAGGYGYGPTGMVIGIARTDSLKNYGWFQSVKAADIFKSLVVLRTRLMHTGAPDGFSRWITGRPVLKGQKTIAPSKFNNKLFADLVALRLNIVASAMQMTPLGFGELIYQEAGNPYSGKMLRELACIGDTLMMGWQVDTTIKGRPAKSHHFAAPEVFFGLDTVIDKINNAFEGVLDTVSFSDSLVFTGTRSLASIPFLSANPEVTPAVVVSLVSDRQSQEMEAEVPGSYQLYQNYPNPFNPTTTIRFDLPTTSVVTIKIHNILGQEVATLFDHELLSDGPNEVEFNAAELASGVYFYRIIAEGTSTDDEGNASTVSFQTVKKMMLIK